MKWKDRKCTYSRNVKICSVYFKARNWFVKFHSGDTSTRMMEDETRSELADEALKSLVECKVLGNYQTRSQFTIYRHLKKIREASKLADCV